MTEPTTTTTAAPAPTTGEAPNVGTCPNCGSHVLFEVVLEYAGTNGFRTDHYGVTPELGDTIASCGDCAHFVILAPDGTAAHAPTSEPSASSSPSEQPAGEQPAPEQPAEQPAPAQPEQPATPLQGLAAVPDPTTEGGPESGTPEGT